MSNLEKLEAELRTADEKRHEFEIRISALKKELGTIIIEKGSNSSEYKEAAKKFRIAEDSLRDLETLSEAIRGAIKQSEKEERMKLRIERSKKNLEIVEHFKRDPPPCPKCGTNKFVQLANIRPSSACIDPADGREIWALDFDCTQFYVGHRFTLVPSEWESLIHKVGTTAKKVASIIASVF